MTMSNGIEYCFSRQLANMGLFDTSVRHRQRNTFARVPNMHHRRDIQILRNLHFKF